MNDLPVLFALLPAALLLMWIWGRDKYQREPFKMVMLGVVYGLLSVPASFTISMPLSAVWQLFDPAPLVDSFFNAFFAAALAEEVAKFVCLHYFLKRNKFFDEYMDGIVYAVCVGLGFAALENVMYVLGAGGDWLAVGSMRFILAVPGHYAFAVLMGYCYSMWRMGGKRHYLVLTLLAPIMAHGIYDFILMSSDQLVTETYQGVLSFLVLMGFLVLLHLRCRHAIRQHLAKDKNIMDERMSRMQPPPLPPRFFGE